MAYVLSHEHDCADFSESMSDFGNLLATDVIDIDQDSLFVLIGVLPELLPVIFLFNSLFRLLLCDHLNQKVKFLDTYLASPSFIIECLII